jgi:hypothetical protein
MAPVRSDGGIEMSDHIPDVTKMISDTPAFPCVYYSEPIGSIGPQFTIKGGMTLRDYFAGKALQGMIASCTQQNWKEEYAAKASYQLADAMLKAREKAK